MICLNNLIFNSIYNIYKMFNQYDKVYIKKYYGNELKADTKKIYEITELLKTKNCMHNNTTFEKNVMLNNGKEQLMYTYNILTKNREYYIEKVPWHKSTFCCCM